MIQKVLNVVIQFENKLFVRLLELGEKGVSGRNPKGLLRIFLLYEDHWNHWQVYLWRLSFLSLTLREWRVPIFNNLIFILWSGLLNLLDGTVDFLKTAVVKELEVFTVLGNGISYWLLLTVGEFIVKLWHLLEEKIPAQVYLFLFDIKVNGGALIHMNHSDHQLNVGLHFWHLALLPILFIKVDCRATKLNVYREPPIRVWRLICLKVVPCIHHLLHLLKLFRLIRFDQFALIDIPKLREALWVVRDYVPFVLQHVVLCNPRKALKFKIGLSWRCLLLLISNSI